MTVRYLNEADAPASDEAATPDGDRRPSTREELGRYADQGGFTMTAETHPWLEAADAVAGPEDARAASTVLAELRSRDIREVGAAVTGIAGKAGLDVPDTVAGLKLLLDLFQRVHSSSTVLSSDAYHADLHALTAATASGRWRKQQGVKIGWGKRRVLRAEARGLTTGKRVSRGELHTVLAEAAAARADWAALTTGDGPAGTVVPAVPMDGTLLAETAQAVENLAEAVRALGLLLPERTLDAQPLAELADLVDRLASDEGTLYRLTALRTLRAALAEEGLADLLDELAERQADREAALAAYDRHVGPEDDGEVAARQALAAGPRAAEETAEDAAVDDVVDEGSVEAAVAVDADAGVEVEAEVEVEVEASAELRTDAEAGVEADVEGEADVDAATAFEVEVRAEVEAVADEPEADVEDSADVVTEPVVDAVEAEAVADVTEAEPVAVEDQVEPVAVEPALAEPEGEPFAVEESVADVTEVEVAVGVEPVVEPALAELVAVEPAPVEPAPVEPALVEPEVEPVAVEPEVEPVAVELPVEPEAEAVAAEVSAQPAAGAPAERPEITPGRPITAYAPAELAALVRWLDADGVARSDDELLRAAMKELGFARLGPRIKDALGTAVAEVRG